MFNRSLRFALLASLWGVCVMVCSTSLNAQTAVPQPHMPSKEGPQAELPAAPIKTQASLSVESVSNPLTLIELLNAASVSYPMLVAARTEAKATLQDVKAVERSRWPNVSATVESNTGNLRSTPSQALQVEQTIWDAGRSSARINESKVLADISLLKVYLQQQDVYLQIANAWQSAIASRERLAVAERTLLRLRS